MRFVSQGLPSASMLLFSHIWLLQSYHCRVVLFITICIMFCFLTLSQQQNMHTSTLDGVTHRATEPNSPSPTTRVRVHKHLSKDEARPRKYTTAQPTNCIPQNRRRQASPLSTTMPPPRLSPHLPPVTITGHPPGPVTPAAAPSSPQLRSPTARTRSVACPGRGCPQGKQAHAQAHLRMPPHEHAHARNVTITHAHTHAGGMGAHVGAGLGCDAHAGPPKPAPAEGAGVHAPTHMHNVGNLTGVRVHTHPHGRGKTPCCYPLPPS